MTKKVIFLCIICVVAIMVSLDHGSTELVHWEEQTKLALADNRKLREENKELEKECARLRAEVKALTDEIVQLQKKVEK